MLMEELRKIKFKIDKNAVCIKHMHFARESTQNIHYIKECIGNDL